MSVLHIILIVMILLVIIKQNFKTEPVANQDTVQEALPQTPNIESKAVNKQNEMVGEQATVGKPIESTTILLSRSSDRVNEPIVSKKITFSGLNITQFHCNGEDVEILHDGINFRLTGQCHSVKIYAPEANVSIQKTQFLSVSGPAAVVKVEQVDDIKISGPNAIVYYRYGLKKINPTADIVGPNARIIQN